MEDATVRGLVQALLCLAFWRDSALFKVAFGLLERASRYLILVPLVFLFGGFNPEEEFFVEVFD